MKRPNTCHATLAGAVLMISAAFWSHGLKAAERVVTIPTPRGETVQIIEIGAKDRAAPIVLLFNGGSGKLRLDRWDGTGNPTENFLIRSRGLFAAQGFHVAVMDAPSDRLRKRGGLAGWRISDDHARDVGAVIDHMRKLSSGPVILIGTSRGTISAANGAARLPRGTVAALVLFATVTRHNKRGDRNRVQDADLSAITVPVLLAHHREDECYITVADDLPDLAKEFPKAPSTRIVLFEGGGPFGAEPCTGRSAHRFFGAEAKAVSGAAKWIREVTGRTPAR